MKTEYRWGGLLLLSALLTAAIVGAVAIYERRSPRETGTPAVALPPRTCGEMQVLPEQPGIVQNEKPQVARRGNGSREYFITTQASYGPGSDAARNDAYLLGPDGRVDASDRGWITLSAFNSRLQEAPTAVGIVAYLRMQSSAPYSIGEFVVRRVGEDGMLGTSDDQEYVVARDKPNAFPDPSDTLGGFVSPFPNTTLIPGALVYMRSSYDGMRGTQAFIVRQEFGRGKIEEPPVASEDGGGERVDRRGFQAPEYVYYLSTGLNKVVSWQERRQDGSLRHVLMDPGPNGRYDGIPPEGDDRRVVSGEDGTAYVSPRISFTGTFVARGRSTGAMPVPGVEVCTIAEGNVERLHCSFLSVPDLPPTSAGPTRPFVIEFADVDEGDAGGSEVGTIGSASDPSGTQVWFLMYAAAGADGVFNTTDDVRAVRTFPRRASDYVRGFSLRGGVVAIHGKFDVVSPSSIAGKIFTTCF